MAKGSRLAPASSDGGDLERKDDGAIVFSKIGTACLSCRRGARCFLSGELVEVESPESVTECDLPRENRLASPVSLGVSGVTSHLRKALAIVTMKGERGGVVVDFGGAQTATQLCLRWR